MRDYGIAHNLGTIAGSILLVSVVLVQTAFFPYGTTANAMTANVCADAAVVARLESTLNKEIGLAYALAGLGPMKVVTLGQRRVSDDGAGHTSCAAVLEFQGNPGVSFARDIEYGVQQTGTDFVVTTRPFYLFYPRF